MPQQLRIEEQIRLADERERSYRVLCMKHPDWRPDPSKPEPPRGSCPFCRDEAMGNRPTDRPAESRRVGIVEPPIPPSQHELMTKFYEAHPDRAPWLDREKEAEALERIEEARQAEQDEVERLRASVRARGAKLRHANSVTGVEIWDTPWSRGPVVMRRGS